MESVEVDLRGQICPSSLLSALKEINVRKAELKSGKERISILTDNRDAIVTIPDSAAAMGYDVSVEKEQGYYRIDVFQAL